MTRCSTYTQLSSRCLPARTPHELSGEGVKQELRCGIATSAASIFTNLRAVSNDPGGWPCSFPLAFIRGQTLHAAGRQLAALVEEHLQPTVALAEADAGGKGMGAAAAAARAAPPRPTVKYTAALLRLVYGTVESAATLDEPQALQLREELAAALEGSQVLEHAGRALLLLFRLGMHEPRDGLESAAAKASLAYVDLSCMYECAPEPAGGAGGPKPAGDVGAPNDPANASMELAVRRIRLTASGACARHVALCLGLAVLCDADGGPAYGLPPELLAALPAQVDALAGAGGSPHAGRGMSGAASMQLAGMLAWLELANAAPPWRRATLALAMRVGWLAVASAWALTDEEGDGASGGGARSGGSRPADGAGTGGGRAPPEGGRPRRVIPRLQMASLALGALRIALRSLALRPPTAAVTAAAVAEAARWWRLAVAIAADVLPYMTAGQERAHLGMLMSVFVWSAPTQDALLSLPPEPPPEVAAALGGGLLRCLERLMRRAGRDPQGPDATVLRTLRKRTGGTTTITFSYMFPLLAYGEPRQVAALLATLRKLLRTVDPRAPSNEFWVPEDDTHQGFVATACAALGAASVMEEQAMALGDGPPPSPASQQLLRQLSFAACQLLPELSQMTMRLMLLPAATSLLLKPQALILVMQSVYSMAHRCAGAALRSTASSPPGDEGDAGSGPDGSTGHGEAGDGGDDDDDGGWRALLLKEVGAVPLLDAALRWLVLQVGGPVPQQEYRPWLLRNVVMGCCLVAAVATAAVLAPAEAAAGASPQLQPDPDMVVSTAVTGLVGQPAADAAEGAELVAAGGGADTGGVAFAPDAAGAPGPPGPSASPDWLPVSTLLPWRPELLREAAAQLRSHEDQHASAEAEHLAAYLDGRGGGGAYQTPQCARSPLAFALTPPDEARRLLPGRCANPACANLEGDSEADLSLKACAGCGAVGYCCRLCQLEHWRAGHKEACGQARGGSSDGSRG
ncbi:hypothetical protein GPECTOR_35g892 [Gonium pectorale]|uniref:phytol kinase n=1 Tax=Gonium pectorale TaxID=33097 RepID=A0A150GC93_GONPE|nr:hypothetical protein GPECTOR_35g892 [Gonium pectorale]|eukprot:KXZ47454.1 hypothetical protein GPECTOR_35g892 [Gonium pectorale]